MKLPTAEHFGLTEDKEQRLSEIIDEINSRTGKSYDNDVVVKAMLQIRDILMNLFGLVVRHGGCTVILCVIVKQVISVI